ncbi:hypothetical protein EVA25_02050 [bacterium]|nr:MAG: hypothetical protein EVA25_02050 [bacterium]
MTDRYSFDLVLLGFGAVAQAFVKLLMERSPSLGFDWRVVGVATRRHHCALAKEGIDSPTLTHLGTTKQLLDTCHDYTGGRQPTSTFELLKQLSELYPRHSKLNRMVVVENTPFSLDKGQPSVDHVRTALAMNADVITANKGPAAFAYRELSELATSQDSMFKFEGSVLDGLPVFSLIKETLPGVRVERIRGIVNTTTNYLLTAMEQGDTLSKALADLQKAGITESDPENDIEGWDAAAKASILANVFFDANMSPHEVNRKGLRTVDKTEIRRAHQNGQAVKLIAEIKRHHNRAVATVAPRLLKPSDPLTRLSGTAKGLVIDTDILGSLVINKTTSGVTHTAYALMTDLLSIHRLRTLYVT